ncbi:MULTISPECIES: hypothetical protein [Halorussus]|uniref:hypothetical protein n=1 Tax=Halorussus TaxID=1070314 RepID=UPI0013B405AE|nr:MULTISPECIES: hypothetical protein [Halorussus]NHN61296.1 hypothetical protein [Halorussus sp. JP-T4]
MTTDRTPASQRVERAHYGTRQHPAEAVADERPLYGEPQHERATRDPDAADRISYEDDHWLENSLPPDRPAVADAGEGSGELLA